VASTLFSLLLFFLPFVFLPFPLSPFEVPKVLVAEILISLIFLKLSSKNKFFKPDKSNKILIIFIVLTFLILLVNLATNLYSNSFFGNAFRKQGAFLTLILLLFTYTSSKFRVNIPKNLPVITYLILFILSFTVGSDANGRIVGSIGEANSLAAYFLFLWPFVFFNNVKKSKTTTTLVFLGTILVILFSGSRSGLIGFVIQAIFLFLQKIKTLKKKAPLYISLLLLLSSLTLPFLDIRERFEDRVEIWQTSVSAGLEKPILGWGFGNIEYALEAGGYKLKNNIRYQYVDSSHNFILDWFVQGGIVGLIAICSLVFKTFDNLYKSKSQLIVPFFGIVTTMLFNPVSVCILVPFWWIVGSSFIRKSSS
jgi:O-antigen ligase